MYWMYSKDACYAEWQVNESIKREWSTLEDYTEIDDEEWKALTDKANNEGLDIVNDPNTNRPMLVPYPEPTKEEKAQQEIQNLKQYLSETDYMAIKCGELGLAMAEEYPVEYQKRKDARARINELEQLLRN